jgi:hypothetical protein
VTGSRIAKECGSSGRYFASIDECIPLSIASMSAFLDAFQAGKVCKESEIDSLEKLEGLRYCKRISTGLTISVFDDDADFTSLFDIETIGGMGADGCAMSLTQLQDRL